MFIPGKQVAEFMDAEGEQIQPAGVDLTVAEVFRLNEAGEIDFTNDNRRVPQGEKLNFKDKIHLEPGPYRVNYGESIKIPEDAAGIVFPRSSLMRMGGTLISALWDPGYQGRGQGLLVVFNPHGITLHKGARVAQMFMVRGESSGTYEGTYHGENL